MDIICKQESLAKGLNIALRAVTTRGALPVTTHLLLETDDGMLKITGTDLNTLITTWVPCTIIAEGAITVPAKLLTDYIGAINAEEVELVREDNNALLKVTADRSRTNINGGMPAEFPPAPSLEDEDVVTVNLKAQTLRNAIQKVAMAAATEESRPVLTGVQIKLANRQLTLAAADGFRLAVHTEDLGEDMDPDTQAEFIVPAKSLTELQRLLTSPDDTVVMTAGTKKNCAIFKISAPERTEFTSLLLQGSFPNWDGLIPQDSDSEIIVDSQAFLRAVKTASIFAKDGSNIIRLNYGHTASGIPQLNVSANSEEIGQNLEELPLTQATGENGKIAFNHRYLQEGIAGTGPGLITIQTTKPSNPGVLRPHGSTSTIHVIMPMFVQWDHHYYDELRDQPPADISPADDLDPPLELIDQTRSASGDEMPDPAAEYSDQESQEPQTGQTDDPDFAHMTVEDDDGDEAQGPQNQTGPPENNEDVNEDVNEDAEDKEEVNEQEDENNYASRNGRDLPAGDTGEDEEEQDADVPLEPVTVDPF